MGVYGALLWIGEGGWDIILGGWGWVGVGGEIIWLSEGGWG